MRSAIARLLVLVLVIAALTLGFLWLLNKRGPSLEAEVSPVAVPESSSTVPPLSSPIAEAPSPSLEPTPAETPEPTNNPPQESFVGTLNLIIPVAGVRADQLLDTFADSRSEGRVHDAIDIPAPAGTPVLAAADGQVLKLFQSERGGTTIYQLSKDQKLVFYYAHLQRYADGLAQGALVRQGDVIAYVGDTGNAGAGNYHLHFSIAVVSDPKRYWEGTNINPYPLLHR